MAEATATRFLFTSADYHRMADEGIIPSSERVELIRGEIWKMSPINSPHAAMVNRLAELLILELAGKAVVSIQNPVRLDDFSEPEPDIVLAQFRKDRYRDRHPAPIDIFLVIEVANSSLEFDRGVKRSLYAQAGIPEYWIINLPQKQIEVYRQPEHGVYGMQEVLSKKEAAVCSVLDLTIQTDALFP